MIDNIKSITKERKDLATHVDLCQQRWEAIYSKIRKLEMICIMLLIEAMLNMINAALDGRIASTLRSLFNIIM